MCKWVGSFKKLLPAFILFFFVPSLVLAAPAPSASRLGTKPLDLRTLEAKPAEQLVWDDYNRLALQAQRNDYTNGFSYIVSGSLALTGGLIGSNVTGDPIEKGIYALFQTIGIASIGYGAYKWKIGDDQRLLMNSLRSTSSLTNEQRLAFLETYYAQKKETEKRERKIRAITHGLIAALNFYNASQQKQDGVKNTLFFVGGANLLATLSYTF